MTATFIPSGIDRAAYLALLAAEQVPGMINARYALQPALRQAYTMQWPSLPLMLDCGSFQRGARDVAAHAAIIEQIGARFLWISNLDALWQPQVGDKNFAYLQAHLSPALAAKILWIYQPGSSLADVEWFARERGMIGVGGLVPLLKQQGSAAVLHLLRVLGERLNRVGGRAHLFGISSPQILFQVRAEAWLASTDSSKWLVAYRASQVLRTSGTGQCRASQFGLRLSSWEMAANNLRVMQCWLSPTSPMQLALFEEDEPDVTRDDVSDPVAAGPSEDVFQFTLLLCSASMEALLSHCIAHFTDRICSWDGSDEDNEIFVMLVTTAAQEDDIVAWCETVKRIGQLTNYDVWREEEAMAV